MAKVKKVKITESILVNAFDSVLSEEFGLETPSQTLNENVTKSDVMDITRSEIKKFLTKNRNPQFENVVRQMVVKEVKNNKELEKQMKGITKDTLVELYKAMWTKRNFWVNELVK